MKTILEMKAETETVHATIKAELDTLQSMVEYKGYEAYLVEVNTTWDGVQINVSHKKFNWTNFLTITVKGTDFDFSHGSGGFSNSTVDERLKATKDMFDIVTLLQTDTAKIEEQRVLISKLSKVLDTKRETCYKAQEAEALENAYANITKDHKEISSEGILETIQSGGSLYVYSINCNHELEVGVQKNVVENRSTFGIRANFYFQDFKYSKKDLMSVLSTRRFFVEN